VRRLWRRLRGWWLLTAAAVATAVLSAVGQLFPGIVAGIAVAIGGVVAGVVSDRGRAQLTVRSAPAGVLVTRVDRLTDPLRLRVHRAASVDGDRVPPFVARDRLPELVTALREGGFVLVVGDSTAGKTRLAFEAMRICLPGHVCVVPDGDPAAGVRAAVENRPSVLWLDDLDRFLGVGGLSVPDVRTLVAKDVVVLATIRTHQRELLSERHDTGRDHAGRGLARASREILDAVTTEIRLRRRWSDREREAAAAFADDPRIAAALANADRHGLAEHMAAGPQLVRDLTDARDTVTTARGAALVTAAVDLRRASFHRPVPVAVLKDLHETYLRDPRRAESWDAALDWATRPLHATSSLLEPAGDDEYLAFDYLLDAAVQDPETPPVPDAVWASIVEFAEPTALVEVAWEAELGGNVDYLRRATAKAVSAEDYVVASVLADILGDFGREAEAVAYLEEIIAAAGEVLTPVELVRMRRTLAWQIGNKAGDGGDPRRALEISREVVRDSAAAFGEDHPETLFARTTLARQLGASGQPEEALSLARAVVDGTTRVLGPGDHATFNARFELAVWTREVEGTEAGITAFGELLDDMYTTADANVALIADAQWNLGGALIDVGRPEDAVELLDAAVVNSSQARGPNSRMTLDIRLRHLDAISDVGDFARAIDLADTVAADSTKVLGPDHVITLTARGVAAVCLADAGDHAAALERMTPLLADLAHLPADHWLVTEIRTGHDNLLRM
jgi:eukaryotic-like serine/threonine-protein kinase